MKRVLWWIAGILTTVVVVGAAAFVFSPWPSVWLIRRAFDAGARQASAALEKHVPTGVRALIDQPYDPSRRDGLLDAFIPALESMESGQPMKDVAAAARAGAEATKEMTSARAGRSSYVRGDALKGIPDPGAMAVAYAFEALA